MIYLAVLWLLLGVCGYLMLRQGFLVAFEASIGKLGAWDAPVVIVGLIGILYGPMMIVWALLICGRDCFRKRVR